MAEWNTYYRNEDEEEDQEEEEQTGGQMKSIRLGFMLDYYDEVASKHAFCFGQETIKPQEETVWSSWLMLPKKCLSRAKMEIPPTLT